MRSEQREAKSENSSDQLTEEEGEEGEEDVSQIHFFLDGAHTKESINLCIDWFSSSSKSSACLPAQSSSCSSSASGSASSSSSSPNRILLFNCTGCRDPIGLLTPFLKCDHFDAVLFSPNKLSRDKKVSSDQSNFMIEPGSEEKKAVELRNIWTRLKDAEKTRLHQDDTQLRETTLSKIQVAQSFTCLTEAVDWVQRFASQNRRREGDAFPNRQDTHVLVTGSLHLVGGVLGILDPDAQSFKSANI